MKISKKILLLLTAISLLFCLNAQTKSANKIVGKIGTKNYTYEEYNQILNNYYKYWESKGTKVSEEKKKELNNQCWEELIARQVYDQEIIKRKLKPTDQELYNKVISNPPAAVKDIADLKTNKKFDKTKFKMALDKDPTFKKNVLDFVREQYAYDKLFASIKSVVKVNSDSIYRDWKKKNDKGSGKIITFNVPEFANQPVTDEEADAYYKANYETYKREPSRKYKYIKLVNAPSIEDTLAIKNQVDSLYYALINGANFEETAIAFSEDPGSGKKGGDLGYFGRGRMVAEFDRVSFETPVGQISQPVKTNFGYHIIKVYDRKQNAQGQEEVKASHILLRFKASAKSISDMKNKALNIQARVNEKGIEVAKTEFNETILETSEFFEKDQFVSGIGNYPELFKFAFNNKLGTVHDLFQDKNGNMFIMQISDSLGIHYDSFEKEKANIVRLIQRRKKGESTFDFAQKFVISNKPEQYLEKAIADSLTITDFQDINIDSYLPKLGRVNEINQAIIKAKAGEFSPIIKTEKAIYMVYVSKRDYTDDKNWLKIKNKEIQKVKEQMQTNYLNKWYADQKTKIKIEDKRKDFYTL